MNSYDNSFFEHPIDNENIDCMDMYTLFTDFELDIYHQSIWSDEQ